MTFNNIKTMKNKESGFTIVELLIVIVIIGILAALVIVAYTGITARANSTKAKTNATSVQKKVEAWAADSSAGPSTGTPNPGTSGVGNYPLFVATGVSVMTGSAVLPSGVTVVRADPTSLNGTTTVGYKVCDSGAGYQVLWWDFANNQLSAGANIIAGGTQGTCGYPAS